MHFSVDISAPAGIALRETLAFLDAHLPEPGSRVLEVGCGDGALAASLGDRGFMVRGIDVDPGMVSRARERGVDAHEADLVSYSDEPFDVLLFSDAKQPHQILVPKAIPQYDFSTHVPSFFTADDL